MVILDESFLINKISHYIEIFIRKHAKVSDFITVMKKGNLHSLNNIIRDYIIGKIKIIPIPLTNMEDKLV